MSFTDKSFSCDVLASISPVKTPAKPVLAKKSKPAPAEKTPVKPPVKPVLAKKSKPAPAEKENQPPQLGLGLGNLYRDKTIFTQELSQPQQDGLLMISFTQDEDLSDSLTKDVNQAVQNPNLFTPIKRVGLSLLPAKSPAPQASFQTSTPVRPVKISQELQQEEVEMDEAPADTSTPFDLNFME